MEQKGVSPVVGTILLIAITVALAAIVAMLVSGLGGRGAPPSAMLTVTADNITGVNPATDDNVIVTISHEGGDDLVLTDIMVQASREDGTMVSIPMNTMTISGDATVLSVGRTAVEAYNYDNSDYAIGNAITVYIIHEPSKQKMFSSSGVVIALA